MVVKVVVFIQKIHIPVLFFVWLEYNAISWFYKAIHWFLQMPLLFLRETTKFAS